jgi:hypothetical protein
MRSKRITKIIQMLIGCVCLAIQIQFVASFSILSTHQAWRSSLLGSKKEVTVQVEAQLDDKKTKELFAWIHRAWDGDGRYNDLMTAIAAVFGDIHELDPMEEYVLAITLNISSIGTHTHIS